ncbi:MAG: hypothetical protein WC211_03610 [Dehalococcoidia bacterium]
MRDTYTNWRVIADGDLTATETAAGIEIGQAPIEGFPVVVHIPEQDDAADTLDITWEESDALAGTYREFQKTRPRVTGSGTAAAPISLPDRLHNNLAFVRCVLTVAGATPNFGAVSVGMDAGAFRNALQAGPYTAP